MTTNTITTNMKETKLNVSEKISLGDELKRNKVLKSVCYLHTFQEMKYFC